MKFTTAQILSVTTDKLFCEDFGDVYKILNYLTRDNLFTHQLPRANETCCPHVKKQLPWTKNIDASEVDGTNFREFLDSVILQYGSSHNLEPIPKDGYHYKDPVEELDEMVGPDRIIILEVKEPENE